MHFVEQGNNDWVHYIPYVNSFVPVSFSSSVAFLKASTIPKKAVGSNNSKILSKKKKEKKMNGELMKKRKASRALFSV